MVAKKKSVLLTVLVVLCIAVAAWRLHIRSGRQTNSPGQDGLLKRPLVVGLVSWPGYTGGIVANNGFEPNADSIFTRKYGVKVKFVLLEDIDARGKAFAKGGPDGLDIVWSTVDFFASEAPNFQRNDVHPVAIMQVDWSQGGDAIVAGSSIQKVEDLKGKRVSLVQFTPSNWLLENALKNSKLSSDEQEGIRRTMIFTQDVPSARQAFVAGRVDAAVLWEPDVSEALSHKAGSHVLLSTSPRSKVIADLMISKREFAESYPLTIEGFVRGWLDGVEEAKKNPDTAVNLLMKNELLFRDLGLQETRKALSWVKLADLSDNVEMFGLDGKHALFDQILSDAGQFWHARGFVAQAAEPSTVKDDRFLKAIYGK